MFQIKKRAYKIIIVTSILIALLSLATNYFQSYQVAELLRNIDSSTSFDKLTVRVIYPNDTKSLQINEVIEIKKLLDFISQHKVRKKIKDDTIVVSESVIYELFFIGVNPEEQVRISIIGDEYISIGFWGEESRTYKLINKKFDLEFIADILGIDGEGQ